MTVLIPTVRNVRDVGKRTTDDRVYVGRRTKWGNPWSDRTTITPRDRLLLFRQYAEDILRMEPDFFEPLRGKDLVCWCAPEPCHADILLELANR